VVLARTWHSALVGLAAVMASGSIACAPRQQTAGFWFADGALTLPDAIASQLGGPLTGPEADTIEATTRTEIARAFSGLTIAFTENHEAFWRVAVMRSLPSRSNMALPHAGESLAMGFMGSTGAVDFEFVAFEAMHFTVPGTPRTAVVEGIGRGLGRVAIHEFMHQILGNAIAHNDRDVNSYEYGSPERRSQYYGELHWTTAWPLLRQKLGSRQE
jgi:hypothetical protein